MRSAKIFRFFLIVVLVVLFTAGCGSSGSYNKAATQESVAAMADQAADNKADLGFSGAAKTNTIKQTAAQQQPSELTRKIIKDATFRLEVADLDSAITKLTQDADQSGGYVEQMDSNETEKIRQANLVLRIPVDKFDPFIGELASVGNIKYRAVNGQDISEQYYDTAARKRTLLKHEERLLQIMEKAKTVEELIKVEGELARVRQEIEALEGRLKVWDNLTSLATLRIQLSQAKVYFPEVKTQNHVLLRAQNSFVNSLLLIKNLAASLVVISSALLPFVPLIALLGYIGWKARKKCYQRKE